MRPQADEQIVGTNEQTGTLFNNESFLGHEMSMKRVPNCKWVEETTLHTFR